MDDQMMQDEAAQPEEQGAGGGYVICIYVAADKSISVGVETAAQEGAEGEGGSPGEPVDGIKGAIEIVLDIYKNGGQVQDAAAGEDDFRAGYAEGDGNGTPAELARRFA